MDEERSPLMIPSDSEPEYTPAQQRLIVAGLGLIVAVFYITAVVHFSYTPDESFVIQRYARNLALGNGYSFNAGEPAYGVTSPLWVFTVAGENLFHIDTVTGAKALDLFAGSLALVMFFLTAYEILRHRLIALLATLVFSMNLTFLRWAATGMEISLAVFLLLAAMWYCLRNEYAVGSIFAGLLALVRPEGGLVMIAVLIDIATNTVEPKRAFRIAAASLGIFIVINIPWCIYAAKMFGTTLPAAMVARGGLIPRWADILYAFGSGARTIGASDALSVVLILGGVFLSFAGGRRDSPSVRLLALPFAWIAVGLAFYFAAGGDIAARSLLLILPLVTIGGFWGARKIQERFGVLGSLGLNFYLLIAAALLIQNQTVYYHTIKPFMLNYAQGSEDALGSIGAWCADSTPADAVIACSDVGMIGYKSNRKICDLGGVVTPELLPVVRRGISYDEIMLKKLYRTACVPDYIVDRATVADRLTDDDLLPLFHRAFYGTTVTSPRVVYYTVYQVRHDVNQKAVAAGERP